jgi:hypothetical protein
MAGTLSDPTAAAALQQKAGVTATAAKAPPIKRQCEQQATAACWLSLVLAFLAATNRVLGATIGRCVLSKSMQL